MTKLKNMSTKPSPWKNKYKFEVDNIKYSAIRDYVESATPYLFSEYNLFRKNTGIRINSQETAEQFLSYMEEKKANKHNDRFSGPVSYKGKDYKTLTSLFKALKCTERDYYNYKQYFNGSTIESEEDVCKFVNHLKEKIKKEQKNEQIGIEYDNVKYKSIANLLASLGFKVHEYAYYRIKTGKNIRIEKDVKEFLDYMEEKNGKRARFQIKYEKLQFRSRKSLFTYLGYELYQYYDYKNRTGKEVRNVPELNAFLKDMTSRGKPPIKKSERVIPHYMENAS